MKLLYALLTAGFLYPALVFGAAQVPPPQVTPLTRGFLTNATALGARNALGIGASTNFSINNNQFVFDADSNLVVKSGASLTNPVFGSGWSASVYGATNLAFTNSAIVGLRPLTI